MTKWLLLSFARKRITALSSGKEKIVQTGPLLFLKKQNPEYREHNTYWWVYFWGPANASGMFKGIGHSLNHLKGGDGDGYKDVLLQHRVSPMFFLCSGKSSEKLGPSPIFIIAVCWEGRGEIWNTFSGLSMLELKDCRYRCWASRSVLPLSLMERSKLLTSLRWESTTPAPHLLFFGLL